MGLPRRRTRNEELGAIDLLRTSSQGKPELGWGGRAEANGRRPARWDLQSSLNPAWSHRGLCSVSYLLSLYHLESREWGRVSCFHTSPSLTKCLSGKQILSGTTSHSGNHCSRTWLSSISSLNEGGKERTQNRQVLVCIFLKCFSLEVINIISFLIP